MLLALEHRGVGKWAAGYSNLFFFIYGVNREVFKPKERDWIWASFEQYPKFSSEQKQRSRAAREQFRKLSLEQRQRQRMQDRWQRRSLAE